MHRRAVVRAAALGVLALRWSGGHAQAFPNRPIRLVVTFPTGGAPDILARLFADVEAAGLTQDVALATWDLRPRRADSDFLVAILSPAG